MKNCQYKSLHHTSAGSISHCSQCGNLKVRFGHLMSFISEDAFKLILNDFNQRRAFYYEDDNAQSAPERIIICLNKNNLFLNLSPEEFDDLYDLFDIANHMLEVNTCLNISE
ncbi:DUF6686 family protein [Crocinitomix algicola]|uniref:DUF6686 family protein n=1 Tax=Crocinitomix algicola TaxID=1740263 RepID=UPI001112CD01|nr:DUF6686 family protein [Crocinitomix algicola]